MSTSFPHRIHPNLLQVLILVLLVIPARLPALEEDTEQPLYLEADSAEIDEATSTSVYTGNVFVKQGSMELRGDRVTVHHDAEHKPELIIAVGSPATYRQEVEGEKNKKQEVKAHALRMEYDRAKDEITLIEQAVLFQGKDNFRNDRIVYDRAKAQVKAGTVAEGKERVKITISPSRK